MLFLRKADETIWKPPPPPLTKSTPPPPPSTNLGFLSNSFMTLLFVQISKTRYPPNFRREETMTALLSLKPKS